MSVGQPPEQRVEWFQPTSGRGLGLVGLGVALLVLFLVGVDGLAGADLAVACAAAFFAVLVWATMLRPRAGLTDDELVLRNPVSDLRVPLASIERLGLRQVLAVRAGERRFVSPAVGRSMRSMRRGHGKPPDPLTDYADFVEDRIRRAMESARTRAGVRLMSDEQLELASGVRRDWAAAEILGLGITSVGFVLAALL